MLQAHQDINHSTNMPGLSHIHILFLLFPSLKTPTLLFPPLAEFLILNQPKIKSHFFRS